MTWRGGVAYLGGANIEVVFVRPPAARIHPLQQKAKHHFQF